MITIIKDKDPIWEVNDYDVVLVGTNIYSMLTNGFQSKIASMFPDVDVANTLTKYGDSNKLGKRLTLYDLKPIISLMYICGYPHSKRQFAYYAAIEQCLATADAEFKGKRVMTTLLGTTRFDGNGERDVVMKIIEENTKNLDLFIYDYEQLDKRDERKKIIKELREKDYEQYKKIKKNMTEYYKKFYLA